MISWFEKEYRWRIDALCAGLRVKRYSIFFYECRFNNEVWSMCQPNLPHIEGAMWENMSEWTRFFQRLEDSGVVDLWLIMCWLIWTNRNQCFYNSSCKRPSGIVKSANQIREDFISASIRVESIQTVSDSVWKSPIIGAMKLNVDAAFYPTSREAGLRMVVRDHMG